MARVVAAVAVVVFVVVLPVCRMFHLSQSAIEMYVSFPQLSVAL